MKRILLAAFALGSAALAVPAHAQDAPGDKVNQLIVYGDDPCPASTAEMITVCVRMEDQYRIPEPLRQNPTDPRNEAWSQKVKAYETVGAFGTKSCSPVGPGGATGCLEKLIGSAYAEKATGENVQMGKLIEAEREKRLSTIDSEAAEEQARVEELEKQYEEKRKREEAGVVAPAAPDATATTPAP